jgi:putative hydrolase of the HAD superfamily
VELINRKYSAVIFDLFGTLVDNFTNTEYQAVLAEMSSALKAPPAEFSKMWRDLFPIRVNGTHSTAEESIEFICRQLGCIVNEKQIRQAVNIRLEYSVKSLKPRAASIPTINKLKALGHKVGLISDCSPETPAVWPRTAFANLFDVTIFSCVAGMKKPDPRIYHLACNRLGVKPSDCLYIGDGSSHELTGALEVGMHPALIRDPDETSDTHFIDREEDWRGDVISSLTQVLDLVE